MLQPVHPFFYSSFYSPRPTSPLSGELEGSWVEGEAFTLLPSGRLGGGFFSVVLDSFLKNNPLSI